MKAKIERGLDKENADVTSTHGPTLEIVCGDNTAYLHLSRMSKGSTGVCVLFDNLWMTPNEFQAYSGRKAAKDWKRSIKHHGKSLKLLIKANLLTLDPPSCKCETCSGIDNVETAPKAKVPEKDGATNEKKKEDRSLAASGTSAQENTTDSELGKVKDDKLTARKRKAPRQAPPAKRSKVDKTNEKKNKQPRAQKSEQRKTRNNISKNVSSCTRGNMKGTRSSTTGQTTKPTKSANGKKKAATVLSKKAGIKSSTEPKKRGRKRKLVASSSSDTTSTNNDTVNTYTSSDNEKLAKICHSDTADATNTTNETEVTTEDVMSKSPTVTEDIIPATDMSVDDDVADESNSAMDVTTSVTTSDIGTVDDGVLTINSDMSAVETSCSASPHHSDSKCDAELAEVSKQVKSEVCSDNTSKQSEGADLHTDTSQVMDYQQTSSNDVHPSSDVLPSANSQLNDDINKQCTKPANTNISTGSCEEIIARLNRPANIAKMRALEPEVKLPTATAADTTSNAITDVSKKVDLLSTNVPENDCEELKTEHVEQKLFDNTADDDVTVTDVCVSPESSGQNEEKSNLTTTSDTVKVENDKDQMMPLSPKKETRLLNIIQELKTYKKQLVANIAHRTQATVAPSALDSKTTTTGQTSELSTEPLAHCDMFTSPSKPMGIASPQRQGTTAMHTKPTAAVIGHKWNSLSMDNCSRPEARYTSDVTTPSDLHNGDALSDGKDSYPSNKNSSEHCVLKVPTRKRPSSFPLPASSICDLSPVDRSYQLPAAPPLAVKPRYSLPGGPVGIIDLSVPRDAMRNVNVQCGLQSNTKESANRERLETRRPLPVNIGAWSVDDVSNFVFSLPGCSHCAKIFHEHRVTGRMLRHLGVTQLVNVLHIDRRAAETVRWRVDSMLTASSGGGKLLTDRRRTTSSQRSSVQSRR